MDSESQTPETAPQAARKVPARPRRRWLIGFLFVGSTALGVGGYLTYSLRGSEEADVITRRPTVGDFFNDIAERGEVESSSNIELRCEVSSAEGVRILEIVPEGTLVHEGDTVVQLDDSTIRKDLNAQRIAVNSAEAAYSKVKNELDANVIARKEYELGTFVQEEQKLESELFVAEENARRARNYHSHSLKLAARGYITDTQLESDRFAVDKYQKDLDAATTKLRVIREYTKPKTLKKHDSDIKTAEAAVNAEKAKYDIEVEKLGNLENQLQKCIIKAPATGQVVFHNPNRWRNDEFTIRKGNRVRERQVIVTLPDVSQMQIKAKVSEARIDRVKPDMEARMTVEAMRGTELHGRVKTVSAYASDEVWFNASIKEYDALISVADPPPSLKPGMSAQVSIRIETQHDVLQVPVQCVVERRGKHYGVVKTSAGKLELRELMIGSTNEKFIIIKDGIAANDDVVMNPRIFLARLGVKDELESDKSPTDGSKSESPATPVAEKSKSQSAT